MNERDLQLAKAMVDLELEENTPKKTQVSRMKDKQQTFSNERSELTIEPVEPRRRTRSLNAPSPIQQFGPCGRIMKNSAMVMTIQDPASQRLTWYKPPLTVLVIKKIRDSSVLPPFVQLVTWLIEEKRMVVFVEASVLEDPALARDPRFQGVRDRLQTFRDGTDDLQDRIDFIVCLGGDGTLLYASLLFQQSVPPVMAFHLGSLGFLTPFEFDNFEEQVTNVLEVTVLQETLTSATPSLYSVSSIPDIPENTAIPSTSKTKILQINKISKKFSTKSNTDRSRICKESNSPCSCQIVKYLDIQSEIPEEKYQLGEASQNPLKSLYSSPNESPEKCCHAALTLRSRLRCIIMRKGEEGQPAKPPTNLLVLNEVVVDRGPSPYLSNIDLFIDGKHVTSVQGDGLIVSTPTGSTAYAVAAGASMIHPSVPAIMITPICPHSLSFRPIVVPAGVELKIMPNSKARNTAYVSFDGRNQQELRVGDSLRVTTSIYPVPSICAADQITDWFDSLAECLHWNVRKRQKHLDELSDLTHSSSNDTLDSLDRDS